MKKRNIENKKLATNCFIISLIAETNNKVAQTFYESLGYEKEVGYVKKIDE